MPNRTEKAPLIHINTMQTFKLIFNDYLQLDECKGQD